MRLLLLKHFSFDDESAITDWAAAHGHKTEVGFPPDGEELPGHESYDLLIILGGPMSVYEDDKHPWLVKEKHYVREAVDSGKLVLGICFGAQMLAELLGASVYRNMYKELGWHRVERTEKEHPLFAQIPQQFISFQWHGDCFDLPDGAVRLASSEACPNQAFVYGSNVVALQFHLEASPPAIEEMLATWSAEVVTAPFIQTPEEIRSQLERSAVSFAMLGHLLDRFTSVREFV
ncbi:type 1 glutamine amidotransferase [Paenibacillus sp. GCM10012307]|uniref:Type 1 glutamine amidotransferase n=1 Tax=Paenibacillus roseus TaxID=2798579 RepID=A0A934J2S6_9BACL|nr:type 1 glutamine amidotransferase [Paenibacillus roseus]MBJ6360544.1 type 1 glutamine amidotransferase [Paenibacillus roseus]